MKRLLQRARYAPAGTAPIWTPSPILNPVLIRHRHQRPLVASLTTFLALAAFSVTIWPPVTVQAQPTSLPEEAYGKIVLPLHESLGGAVSTVIARGNVFEPIKQLSPKDRVAETARSVGRLDILTATSPPRLATCTASVISPQHVLTNQHCLSRGASKASLVIDYLDLSGEGARRIAVDPKPVEMDKVLDYAILQLAQPLPAHVRPVRLADRAVAPRQRLRIIHHPAGRPKVMTQFQCRAARSHRPEAAEVRHTCDTLPGSSGALLFDDDHAGVALHHTGGLMQNDPDSFNTATSIRKLAAKSVIVGRLVMLGRADTASAGQPAPQLPRQGTQQGTQQGTHQNTAANADEAIGKAARPDPAARINNLLNQ